MDLKWYQSLALHIRTRRKRLVSSRNQNTFVDERKDCSKFYYRKRISRAEKKFELPKKLLNIFVGDYNSEINFRRDVFGLLFPRVSKPVTNEDRWFGSVFFCK